MPNVHLSLTPKLYRILKIKTIIIYTLNIVC